MPQAPREYATELLAEVRETHPELRGPRAPARADPARGGNIATESINHIVSAITVRRLCADGIYEAFVSEGRS